MAMPTFISIFTPTLVQMKLTKTKVRLRTRYRIALAFTRFLSRLFCFGRSAEGFLSGLTSVGSLGRVLWAPTGSQARSGPLARPRTGADRYDSLSETHSSAGTAMIP